MFPFEFQKYLDEPNTKARKTAALYLRHCYLLAFSRVYGR